jgi:hypothetical protein
LYHIGIDENIIFLSRSKYNIGVKVIFNNRLNPPYTKNHINKGISTLFKHLSFTINEATTKDGTIKHNDINS